MGTEGKPPSVPPVKAKHKQSSSRAAEKALTRSGGTTGSPEAGASGPGDTCEDPLGALTTAKFKVGWERAAPGRKALQVHGGRAALRGRFLRPHEGPPPLAYIRQGGVRDQVDIRVTTPELRSRSEGDFHTPSRVRRVPMPLRPAGHHHTELVSRRTEPDNGLRESTASCRLNLTRSRARARISCPGRAAGPEPSGARPG